MMAKLEGGVDILKHWRQGVSRERVSGCVGICQDAWVWWCRKQAKLTDDEGAKGRMLGLRDGLVVRGGMQGSRAVHSCLWRVGPHSRGPLHQARRNRPWNLPPPVHMTHTLRRRREVTISVLRVC